MSFFFFCFFFYTKKKANLSPPSPTKKKKKGKEKKKKKKIQIRTGIIRERGGSEVPSNRKISTSPMGLNVFNPMTAFFSLFDCGGHEMSLVRGSSFLDRGKIRSVPIGVLFFPVF